MLLKNLAHPTKVIKKGNHDERYKPPDPYPFWLQVLYNV